MGKFLYTSLIAVCFSCLTANAQLEIDVQKNYKIIKEYTPTFIKYDPISRNSLMGFDVKSNGNIVMAHTAPNDGAEKPHISEFQLSEDYEKSSVNTLKGFSKSETINRVTVISDDWVVVTGEGFISLFNGSTEYLYSIDGSDMNDIYGACFMDVVEMPSKEVVILFSMNRDNFKDLLGLLVLDLVEPSYNYAYIGYEGNYDYGKHDGTVADDFSMFPIASDKVMILFNQGNNGAQNEYVIADTKAVANAGDLPKVDAVIATGSLGSSSWWMRDATYDPEDKTVYFLMNDDDDVILGSVKTADPLNLVVKHERIKMENMKSPCEDAYLLRFFEHNSKKYLVVGGKADLNPYGSSADYDDCPNLNIFNASNFTQPVYGGRTVINKLSGKKENYFSTNSWWDLKEMKFTGFPLPGYSESGNYQQSIIVQVYKHTVLSDDKAPTANLIAVDLTYMGL